MEDYKIKYVKDNSKAWEGLDIKEETPEVIDENPVIEDKVELKEETIEEETPKMKKYTKKLAEDYQGWTNWATWNLALWLGNDEPIYRQAMSEGPFKSPEQAKRFVMRVFPSGTPDMKSMRDFRTANWMEIMDALNEF